MLLSAANNNLDDRRLSTAFYIGYGPAETHDTCHVLPITQNIPSVRCAVAATAACHLANRLDDDQLKRQSLHLRLKATELLRAGLNSDPDRPELTCDTLSTRSLLGISAETERLEQELRDSFFKSVLKNGPAYLNSITVERVDDLPSWFSTHLCGSDV